MTVTQLMFASPTTHPNGYYWARRHTGNIAGLGPPTGRFEPIQLMWVTWPGCQPVTPRVTWLGTDITSGGVGVELGAAIAP